MKMETDSVENKGSSFIDRNKSVTSANGHIYDNVDEIESKSTYDNADNATNQLFNENGEVIQQQEVVMRKCIKNASREIKSYANIEMLQENKNENENVKESTNEYDNVVPNSFSNPTASIVTESINVEEKVKELKNDMSKESIIVKVENEVFRDNIAIVYIYGNLWIAGLNSRKLSCSLSEYLYVGDVVVGINGFKVDSPEKLEKAIARCRNRTIYIQLRRLPFARIVLFKTSLMNESGILYDGHTLKFVKDLFGVKFNSSKPEIESISENGCLYKSGLKYLPAYTNYNLKINQSNVNEKASSSTWTITDVDFKPIGFNKTLKDACEAFCSIDNKDISFIVQPTDLVKSLFKELKNKYSNWQLFVPE